MTCMYGKCVSFSTENDHTAPHSTDYDLEVDGNGKGIHYRENCHCSGYVIYTVSSYISIIYKLLSIYDA